MYNIAQTLADTAARIPYRPAIIFPAGRDYTGRAKFTQYSFQQLSQLCDGYAYGLTEVGFKQGDRTLLMVKPGVELIAATFALLKIGAVPVLIDPGMGVKSFLQCVAETEPTKFIGIPPAQAIRRVLPKPFRTIDQTVSVGTRWLGGDLSLADVYRPRDEPFIAAPTTLESEAAVTFTSGSTGIPKGVVYLHGMFKAQIDLFRDVIGIKQGEVDLPGLPIFALFNPALGVTTIIPDMDSRKPAQLNPAYWVEAILTHGVTSSFGSPTIWKIVAKYCREQGIRLPSMRRIFMASAPVPPWLVRQMSELIDGDIFTPYGATEALPLTMLRGDEIIAETAQASERGAGMCVGQPIPSIEMHVIGLTDRPIEDWDDGLILPANEVGEIVVKGPVVTRLYLNRPYETVKAKIYQQVEGETWVWHRMGDLGYRDEQGRFWFCGRKSHRVETEAGLMLPVPCEAIFNQHPRVVRSALVGLGEAGKQTPVLVVEPLPDIGAKVRNAVGKRLIKELLELGAQFEHTRSIQHVLFHPSFPVDVRHNAKIKREVLAEWAKRRVR